MTQRSGFVPRLAVPAGAAILIALLSIVPGWIHHYREMRGEGYRTLSLELTAWQGGAVPVLSTGIVLTLLAGLTMVAWTRLRPQRHIPAVVSGAAGAGFGLVTAAAWPISHVGQVSGLWLSPGWATFAGILLAGAVVGGGLRDAGARPWVIGVTIGVAAVTLAGGVAARTIILEAAEADRPHWSAGTYSRQLPDGRRQSLTLGDGTYALDDRWSGRFESSGLPMILIDDPACPEARGAYRIFSAGDADIRWELIVDVCLEGSRIADFVGTWQRDD